MFKKLVVALATLVASIGFAFAQVDVNKADQAALDGVKGIGPSISKKIIDERKKGGDFKDWPDLEKRVKGIGAKNAVKFSKAGLTVNNQPLPNAPAAPAAKAKTPAVVAPTAAAVPAPAAKDAKTAAPGTAVTAPSAAATAVPAKK
ncbi:MAG: helix-hairpin-helix domain-containing protein [Herminiimonas sp.]|nr:helix-hairpin-helix domain-containing protein [Herminiimonas sp.]